MNETLHAHALLFAWFCPSCPYSREVSSCSRPLAEQAIAHIADHHVCEVAA